ncbi:MAG: dTDP-glucose 4,6-dehydratase [Candidatus Iainarchaeum archaeon]|uniref:dTDP-glucose 4,6-dehydratase n=1 Tax=Candidatus Iainarchaeum sp. TaxID=3101447 RepID=A0A7T9DKU5_9ARCH|nr:MAG: dTDP-glucose 4,6-dehydratase [Candidatus Diapherotrites archaeon]
MKILITGGSGFIGSHFIKHTLETHPTWEVTNLDKLTYAGRKENLIDVENNPCYHFVHGDIVDHSLVATAMKDCDAVVHFAAESHVDRSIQNPDQFIQTDIIGTYRLLEEARKQDIKKFIQISTDEVYGQISQGSFTEESLLMPRNPYSASKAAADRLAYSYHTTYGLPISITRSSNNYGTHQFPEKLIPLFVTNLIRGKKVPVYGEGKNIRDWLHVRDNCSGIDLVLQKGKNGEVYNIGGGNERTNIQLTHQLLREMGAGNEMIAYVEDRKGHDLRYSLDSSKIQNELGWEPTIQFEQGIHDVVKWYQQNEWWWRPLVKE